MMKKQIFFFALLLMVGWGQGATAQKSVNTAQYPDESQTGSLNFIQGISFTPEGVTKRNPEKLSTHKTENIHAVHVKQGTVRPKSSGSESLIEHLTGIQFKYAMMLGVEVESIKNLALFNFIDSWFGTRYHLGGDSRKGIDCSALTKSLLLAVYGLVVPRTARQQYRATVHIKKDDLRQGDLVFFDTDGGVSHVGLYLVNDYFVHASTSQGVTISSLDDHYYARRFICGGRVEHD
ncbi:MAG: C40 family peptidase [Bacteroidota bacterium]|nr:C40 family peptidase [Bacteroidota bacterium]